MKTTQRFALALGAIAMTAGYGPKASAMELLTFSGFETPLVAEVPSWTLEEFRTADMSMLVDSAQLAGFADNPIDPLNINTGDRGLWIRPFVGNATSGTAEAILSQIVPATPGKEYTFIGDGRFETNFAGNPGNTSKVEFELAFLDSMGAVIGSPLVRDLSTEVIPGLGYSGTNGNPDITPLVGIAPANAASVRVRAQGRDMTTNTVNSGQQSAFVDNFSLTTSDAPTMELLANPNLNITPPSAEQTLATAYTFLEDPDTSTDILRVAGFANNPATGGANGIWVSPFLASAQGGSGVVSQTVPGTPGTNYTFSAGARWELNFVGDASTTDENKVEIELAFLDGSDMVISSVVLDLRDDGKTADNLWSTHSVAGVAPEGTVNVKVSGIVSNLTTSPVGGAQSKFWDDFSLIASTGLDGDYNGDGTVDAADYTVWRDGGAPAPNDGPAGYTTWANNYGATSAPSSAVSIPEPVSAATAVFGFVAIAARRRAN